MNSYSFRLETVQSKRGLKRLFHDKGTLTARSGFDKDFDIISIDYRT